MAAGRKGRSGSPKRVTTVAAAKSTRGNGESSGAVGLRALEIFLEVEARRSFSSAARALSLSQPTVTQRIQALEQALGVQLFNRGQGPVEPTPAATILKLHAERLLAMRNDMLAELRGVTSLRTGMLRVSASTTPGGYVLPEQLQRFGEQFPGVQILMHVGPSDRVIEQVLDGTTEIGVIGKPPADGRVVADPFDVDELVVIARPGHPVLGGAEVPLDVFSRYRVIARERGSATRQTLETALAKVRRQLSVAMELGSSEAIKLAVRAGDGIALVSRRAIAHELALGLVEARPVAGGISRQLHLIRSKSRALSPVGEALWDHLLLNGNGQKARAAARGGH